MVICLERGAYCLHMVQLMPLLPETPLSFVSFKSRLVLLRRLYLSAALFQFFVSQPCICGHPASSVPVFIQSCVLHRLFLALYSHVSCCVCSWRYTVTCPAASVPGFIQSSVPVYVSVPVYTCGCHQADPCVLQHLFLSLYSRLMALVIPVRTCMSVPVSTCMSVPVHTCTHLCVSSCRSTCCRMAACTSSVATKRTTPTSIRTLCTACRRWSAACSSSSIPR